MPPQRNPTELRSALVFGALYAVVLMALSATRNYLGGHGLYAVAILSGLTDMDAITLSAARLVQLGVAGGGIDWTVGWRLIVVATMANLGFKWGMCAIIGGRRLAREVGVPFAAPLMAGGGLLWLWP